uniref:Fibronectin type-III domain-containing protein n=1 Tax=Amphimedon queenslandica TaxID=400682 RepID=A0A1X7SZA0_AMPQE
MHAEEVATSAIAIDLQRMQLFFLLVQLFLARTHSAEIAVQPVSINTTLNSTVYIICEGTGDLLNFLVDSLPASRDEIRGRGFNDEAFEIHGGVLRGILTAKAYYINNNTNISCVITTVSPPSSVASDTVFLTIQGLLNSISNLDYTFINGSSVLLTWTAPYTLDNVLITGYYIVDGLVNITINNTNITISATNPDPCILNNVSVSPINDVGIGSSNNISFYYETAPLITPPVSVVPVIDGQLISLNISSNVSMMCKGEYPNSITVNILNTSSAVLKNTTIPIQVNHQLMIVTGNSSVTNLNTFTVNVSLSNNGGTFNDISSFGFSKCVIFIYFVLILYVLGFLGPVTNIDSSIDNCSTIDITWTTPTVDDRVPIQYYILRLYDANNGSLLDSVSVYNTSYQFVDNNLFIHRYTYAITGVNKLGEGISNNNTFSYQRVPRTVDNTSSLDIISYTQDVVIVQFYIP